MNFYFKHIVLWMKNGNCRTLDFEPGKINVITGGSNTGKSAILDIIDYCLFSSDVKISDSVINENVAWYGIVIGINDKLYTIARTSLIAGKATNHYYFSSVGAIPDVPKVNNDDATIKAILEPEFGIDSKVAVPFGGIFLKAGTKFSLRYFLLFTTLSQNIITNSAVFFDKQNKDRYREALERIFDLAIGVDTIDNVLSREKKAELESQLKREERKLERHAGKQAEFEQEAEALIKRAKEYALIAEDLGVEDSMNALRKVIEDFSQAIMQKPSSDIDSFKQLENQARLTIRNLERLSVGYKKYKANLGVSEDSLKPISYISEKKSDLVKTSIFSELVDVLKKDLMDIKEDVKSRTAIERNISDLIAEEQKKIDRIQKQIRISAQDLRAFKTESEKLFFMGQLAAKLDLYASAEKGPDKDIQKQISSISEDLERIIVNDVSEQRGMTIRLLEEIIQKYITQAGDTLENYRNYHPQFDYKDKALSLRKPLTDYVDSVGSSSNHLFLHLFLFLGLHELVKSKKVPFVPPYLIIDQLSRPYWGEKGNGQAEGIIETGDDEKIRKAFELLNTFVEDVCKDYASSFQMIVLEHVPPEYWSGCIHIHLVEQFVGENALIRPSDMQSGTTTDV